MKQQTQLISLEEVRKIYNRNRYSQKISNGYTESCPNIVCDVISLKAIEELESLPIIDLSQDKTIKTIDEMIEEHENEMNGLQKDGYEKSTYEKIVDARIGTLQVLKSRLYPLNKK